MLMIGIDVASATLEVGEAQGGKTKRFSNDGTGVAELCAWLESREPPGQVQVILEPTSTYHHLVIQALSRRGIAYTCVNPARTKAFAHALGQRAKTDAVDARMLALYGESQQPDPSPSPDEAQEGLKALRRHKESLEREAEATQNRLDAARRSPWTPRAVMESLERKLRWCQEEVERVTKELREVVIHDERWSRGMELLTSIPAVSDKTAVVLLSELPPVERCATGKQWVAFCGVNPEPHDSGKTTWSRLSKKGAARIRVRLYMPAVSALRWNPPIQALGERLKAKGKGGKLRVMASMNKLLRQAFAVLSTGQPFDPSFVRVPALDIQDSI